MTFLLETQSGNRLSVSYSTLPNIESVMQLSAQLPKNPSLVLAALRHKQKVYNDMNRSLRDEEQLRSLSQSTLQLALPIKRSTSMRKRRKQRVNPRSSVLHSLLTPIPHYDLKVFWKEVSGDIGPGTRIGCTLTVVGGEALALYGGEAHRTLNDFWAFSVGSHKWTLLNFATKQLEPRTGHTAIFYKKHLLVAGGEVSNPSLRGHREISPSMLSIDLVSRSWSEVYTINPGLCLRKYHCVVESYRHVLVHGGFNDQGDMLDHPAELSLSSLRWKPIRTVGDGPGERAYHTAVTVKLLNDSAASGIYFFGGLDVTRTARNTLHMLKAGPHGCIWNEVQTMGTPPAPRFQHSMTIFPELFLIVVYGGRRDEHSDSGYRCFGELHLLQLETMCWTTAIFYGSPPENRCGHATAAIGSRLVLFGGLHNSHFCGGSTFIGELNQDKTKTLIDEDERHKELAEKVALFKLRNKQRGIRYTNKFQSADSTPHRSPLSNPSLFSFITFKVHAAARRKTKPSEGQV